MKTAIVPIIKNKTGDTSNKNNYIPIALVTATSKLFCLLEILQMYRITHDHQFGFKTKHYSDMYIFTVKNIIKYYTGHNSPLYTCFPCASKASMVRVRRVRCESTIGHYLQNLLIVVFHSELFPFLYKSTSRNSKYYNGDRFVYMKLNPNVHPPIAPRIKVGDFSCRVQYSSMNVVCERCRMQGHHTHEISKCEAYEAEQPTVHFFSMAILSNFDPCPVTYQGINFKTSEHAYQWSACVEVLKGDLAEEVIIAKCPHDAKEIASSVKSDHSN